MLAFEYLRILAALRPRAFIFENVSGMLTIEEGRVFSEVLEKLSKPAEDLRYALSVLRLNAVDYGVPQFRDRIFIIGQILEAGSSRMCPRFARNPRNTAIVVRGYIPRWPTFLVGERCAMQLGSPGYRESVSVKSHWADS